MARKPIELTEEVRPKQVRSDLLPTEGYSLEVDGKLKTHFEVSEEAFKAALALKTKFPFIQIRIYDAKERTRTPVDLPTA